MISTHHAIDDADLRQLDGQVVISIDPQDAMNLGAMLRAVAAFGLLNTGSTGSAPQMFDDVGRALMDARPFAYVEPEQAQPESGSMWQPQVGSHALVVDFERPHRVGRVLVSGQTMTRMSFGDDRPLEWVPTSSVRPVDDDIAVIDGQRRR